MIANVVVVDQAVLLKPALYVQVIPSGDVAHLPLSPTTQNCVPDHAIACTSETPQVVLDKPVLFVQVIPSGDVAMSLCLPTAQN